MSICNGVHCWWSGNQIDDAYLWGLKVAGGDESVNSSSSSAA